MSQLDVLEPLDPNDTKDYAVYWERHLNGDTIASSSWPVVPSGITKETDSHSTTVATIWISAAANAAGSYQLTNRIITSGGRTLDWTITIRVRSR